MITRTGGETIATSDRVAMMPTVQPAAAGTQEKLELDRTRGGLVRVIGREDIRSFPEMGVSATRPGPCISRQDPVPVRRGRHWTREMPAAGSSIRRGRVPRADRGIRQTRL